MSWVALGILALILICAIGLLGWGGGKRSRSTGSNDAPGSFGGEFGP